MSSVVADLVQGFVRITIAAMAFNVGMNAASSEATELLRRRGFLVRALLGTLLVVPLLAVILVKAVALPNAVATGLLVMAISVGPVAALAKSDEPGPQRSFALGFDIVLLVFNLIFVPIAAWIVGKVFYREIYLSLGMVAKVILPLQLLPLLLGLAVGRLRPRFAERMGKPLMLGVNVALLVVVALVLVLFFKPILALGSHSLAAIGFLGLAALIAAHLLGGPDVADRKMLAAFMAMRYPALALAIAQLGPQGKRVLPTVVAYLLWSVLGYALYSTTLSRSAKHAEHPPDSRPLPSS